MYDLGMYDLRLAVNTGTSDLRKNEKRNKRETRND